MRKLHARMALALAALLPLTACDDEVGPGDLARVNVLLTDAPPLGLDIAEAVVDIDEVVLIRADGEEVVLTEDAGGPVDLLDLQGGVTTALASDLVEEGVYTQIRLIVASAAVRLEGETELTPVQCPSCEQTGIKLILKGADGDDDEGVRIEDEATLVLDFDVSQNFIRTGAGTIIFRPTVRVVVEDVSGSISGTVTLPEGLPRDSVLVSAIQTDPPAGVTPVAATATVNADGSYTIPFVVPGTHRVTVEFAESVTGFVVTPSFRDVVVEENEAETGVDFAVSPAG